MRRTRGIAATVALATVVTVGVAGCRRAAEPPPPAASTAQRLDIKLTTNPSPVTTGTSQMDVTVLQEGKPLTDASVTLELHMPPSGAMGEMRTGAELTPQGDGHYRGSVDVMMAGKWDAIVRVKRGGQVVATYSEPVTAK